MAKTPTLAHGLLGTREQYFTRLLPENPNAFSDDSLDALAAMMIIDDTELKDGADAEENLAVPAGYTYLGQFIDHDITLDTTSSFADPAAAASNMRTPALDLDCLYGAGPQDQPYMYAPDLATLLPADPQATDLTRQGANGRAIIGDKRNDENSMVCQIQLAMVKFHNAVVRKLAPTVPTGQLFERARQEVTWTYQRVVLEDYLLRIVNTHTYDSFTQRRGELGDAAYDLYVPSLRTNLPKEFVAAAYRFGHSMVRTGYRLNAHFKRLVFDATDTADTSLVGFQPLPASHVIDDWGRFFTPSFMVPASNGPDPVDNNPAVRLQYAYKIDPSLVLPLSKLPPSIGSGASLAALNLKRGNLPTYALATGQTFAAKLHEQPLTGDALMVRAKTTSGNFTFRSVGDADPRFLTDTPLWFYVLAEAQQPTLAHWHSIGKRDLTEDDFMSGPCSVSQLGPVGGRILMEVFNGIVDADPRSFRNAAPVDWTPLIGVDISFHAVLKFAGLIPQ